MTATVQNSPILLIEDNPIDLDLTLRAFASRKITNKIEIARDGEEALAFLTRWDNGAPKPSVILLDLNLPKINGLEVLKILKDHPEYKSIPVVILTTSSQSSDMETAYLLGVNSYIIKPVSFEKFMEVATQIDLYWCVLNKLA
ncbi:MAG: response regulator [Lutibacter sp.]